MPPSTRRSLRSKRASPTPGSQDYEAKNFANNNDPILRANGGSNHSDDQQDSTGSKKKSSRSVTFSLDTPSPPSPSVSDASSSLLKDSTVSARAQRSLRRQAKNETGPKKSGKGRNSLAGKGPHKRQRDMKKDGKGKNSTVGNTTTIRKKGASGKDEEVVKVKLNTGTLYLYRGAHRRVVFMRRV